MKDKATTYSALMKPFIHRICLLYIQTSCQFHDKSGIKKSERQVPEVSFPILMRIGRDLYSERRIDNSYLRFQTRFLTLYKDWLSIETPPQQPPPRSANEGKRRQESPLPSDNQHITKTSPLSRKEKISESSDEHISEGI